MTTSEVAEIPTAAEVVRTALLAACEQLHAECTEHQHGLLRRVLSDVPLNQLGEYALRQAHAVLHRAATRNRAIASGLPVPPAPAQSFSVLEFSWPRPPLSRNGGRGHPKARGRIVKDVREVAFYLARQQKIPQLDHMVVRLHYAPGRRQPQDPMNWTDTSKALIDGLRDAGVVVDDDSTRVTEFEPEILFPPEKGPRCWLTIVAA